MTEEEASRKIIDDVYSARRQIYEETKHLTGDEYIAHFSHHVQDIIKRNGYSIISSKDGLGYNLHKNTVPN